MENRKIWLLDFTENALDGLTRCYCNGASAEGYRLLWDKVAEVKSAGELDEPGIYFIVEKKGSTSSKPHIYVGQGDKRKNQKAMLNRVKEHKRKGEYAWADDVIFIRVPSSFGPTELSYLENQFYQLIVEAGAYNAGNQADPHKATPRDEIKYQVGCVIEDAEWILSIFGHRPFTAPHTRSTENKPILRKVATESWENVTQLCKIIARRGGNEGAYGGILQYFNTSKSRKPCSLTSKWRKPLESVGVIFDEKGFVSDWSKVPKEI